MFNYQNGECLKLILGISLILFVNILITMLIKIMKNKLIVNLKVNLLSIINSAIINQLQQNTQVFTLKGCLEVCSYLNY